MGLFSSFFGKWSDTEKNESKIHWKPLQDINQLVEIESKSHHKTQLVFKHSTTCGISRMVLNMFNGNSIPEDQADVYFLDLLANRNVSNAVAEKFSVFHQSPQLLIIKSGEVTFHTSHGAITEINLDELI